MSHRHPFGVSLAVAAILVAAACRAPDRQEAAGGSRHEVVIRGGEFVPAGVRAVPGDTVTWHNQDIVPHTVTAVSGAGDSGELVSGARYTLVIGDGDLGEYRCDYHPTMRARVGAAK